MTSGCLAAAADMRRGALREWPVDSSPAPAPDHQAGEPEADEDERCGFGTVTTVPTTSEPLMSLPKPNESGAKTSTRLVSLSMSARVAQVTNCALSRLSPSMSNRLRYAVLAACIEDRRMTAPAKTIVASPPRPQRGCDRCVSDRTFPPRFSPLLP